MSNTQPLGAQTPPADDSSQSLNLTSLDLPQRITRALQGQLCLTVIGAIYAVLSLNLLWGSLCLGMGGLTYLTLIGLSRWQTSMNHLNQQLNHGVSELTSLTAINRSLRNQLENQPSVTERLKQAEAAALQSEKMATLGMLMAGVAHEINTPLGAIQASAENLDFSTGQTLKYLPQLCQCLGETQLVAFSQLLTWAEQNPGHRSSRQERQLKREIKAKLEALNIENARSIAAILGPMGIDQDLEPILPVLNSPDADMILDVAYNLNAIQDNGQNIGIAISRANNIVASLRNYARKSSQVKPTLSDLRTGIDTVLALYQNKLKHGIEVHKHYDDVPQLLCYAEELDQAWANLIGNAIQAMDSQGELKISLTQGNNNLMVTITDSGPGIPEEAQAQIFTPYFTTKPMGEGSGLGLSITQKIIKRHCGSIELNSQPGKTSFRITLPLGIDYNLEGDALMEPVTPKSADVFWSGTGDSAVSPPPNDSGKSRPSDAGVQDSSPSSSLLSALPPPEMKVPTIP